MRWYSRPAGSQKQKRRERRNVGSGGASVSSALASAFKLSNVCSFESSEDCSPFLPSHPFPIPRGQRLIPFIHSRALTQSSHRHPLEVHFTSHMHGYVFINIHLIVFYFGAFLHTLKSNLKTPKMSDYQPPELTSVNQTGTAVGKC